jgi:hypothetical protein
VAIRFACPNPECPADFTAHDQSAGAEIVCHFCGQRMRVPPPVPPLATQLPADAPSAEAPTLVPLPQPVVRYYRPEDDPGELLDPRDRPQRRRRRELVDYDYREAGRYHVTHQEVGTFGSAFGRTFGGGMGCLAVVAVAFVLTCLVTVFLGALAQPGW